MRITSCTSFEEKKTSLTIEATKNEDLTPLECALIGHQWVRVNDQGVLETAPAHKNPPIVFDKDIDPIWDGKPATIRRLREPDKTESVKYCNRAFYIQSIGGYDGNREKKAQRLILSGFEALRSRRNLRDGKYWEVWYLPGAHAAEGELAGRSEKQIKQWILDVIRPGNLELSGESWGLSVE